MANYSDFMDEVMSEAPGCPYPLALDRLQRTTREFCKRTDCYQVDLDDLSVVSGTQTYTISDPDAYNEIIRLIAVLDENDAPYSSFTFDPPTFKLFDEPTSNFTLQMRASLRPVKGATSYNTSSSADYNLSFTDSDLTAGVLSVNHSLNDQYVYVMVVDNNDVSVVPDEVTYTDANNCEVDLSGYGTLTGTWNLVIFSGSTSLSTVSTSDATSVDDIIYYNYYDGVVAGTLARLLRMPKVPWSDFEMAKIYNSEYNAHINRAKIDLHKQFTARDISVQLREW